MNDWLPLVTVPTCPCHSGSANASSEVMAPGWTLSVLYTMTRRRAEKASHVSSTARNSGAICASVGAVTGASRPCCRASSSTPT